MADNIVRIDGWPVAVGTASAFGRLKAAFEAAFPVTLHVYSGFRSAAEQEEIFRARYRPGAYSPFGDYRWWNGIRWGRVSGEGTVAVPGTSNHGNGRALDIRDSGADAGVTRAGNARSNWIRANAHRFGFAPAGYGFGEPWHIELAGNLDPWQGGVPAGTDQGTAPDDNEEEWLMAAADDIRFIKEQLGGSSSRETTLRQDVDRLTAENEQLRADVDWLKQRVGGSITRKTTLSQDVDAIKSKLKA